MPAIPPRCGCSADTQVLTRRGWVKFDQLANTDKVATRTSDGMLEWQYPKKITWSSYEGDMVRFHSRTTDLLVAPGQHILYCVRQRGCRGGKRIELPPEECVTLASGLVGGSAPLVATSRWEPNILRRDVAFTAETAFSYGGRAAKRPKGLTLRIEDVAAFMGMFLSEGYLGPQGKGNYPIYVTQSKNGRGFDKYQDLLNRALDREVPWRSAGGGNWCFYNKGLYQYLSACGKYAWGKRIPRDVLDLSKDNLDIFWRYYWLGDGSLMTSAGRKDIEVIQTTSKEMAGGLQEILQKAGYWSIVHTVTGRHRGDICGRPITHRRTLYRVVRRAGRVAFATKIERVPYWGKIGHLIVPNGAVYVRRNDHPVWLATTGSTCKT